MKINLLEPCPFCGTIPDLDNPDTLYPSGVGWKHVDNHIEYCSALEVPPDQWCYSIHCVQTSGGCGAEMHGDSKQDTINRWSKRS